MFWGLAVLFCVLGVGATLVVSRFIESFYSYVPQSYEPKDAQREKLLERKTSE
jgi:hypothetical protein